METGWRHVAAFFACLSLIYQAASSDITKKNDDHVTNEHFEAHSSAAGLTATTSDKPNDIQSLEDWLKKRSFGELPFGDQNLQAWQEWMKKRGLQTQIPQGFGKGSGQTFQQWKDWMKKRGLQTENRPGFGEGSGQTIQQWKDWMKKRGLQTENRPGFGEGSGQAFQQWKDWMKKRGLQPENRPGFGEGSGQTIQQWKDWMKKRGLQTENRPGFGGGSDLGIQQWKDWMKKRGLANGYSGSGFAQHSGGKFQSWGDYSKRSSLTNDQTDSWVGDDDDKRNLGTVKAESPFDVKFGSNPRLMKWDELLKRREVSGSHGDDKRQLRNSPSGFGHNNGYFTKGLQDWRNTFHSAKRTNNSEDSTHSTRGNK